ncbi:MAG: polysaccharide deacetylase [Erysipelotrichaceae bacterium]|nr:MAG: polysaccharide [Erysipelotrichaceae bacterium]TXT17608.1 MAG: polysaccharide deacetylase [Erysipelotrichaceae bacterium]
MSIGGNMSKKTKNTQRQVALIIVLIFLIITTSVGGFIFIKSELDKKNNNNNNNNQAEIEKEKAREVKRVELISKASLMVSGYYYEEAIELLKSNSDIYNDKMKSEVKKVEDFVADLEPYTGRIEQVFFHTLIVYPELAFGPNSSQPQGYNYWMTTQLEFQRMLPLLMEKGYVLIRISDLYDVDAQGNVTEKELYLPQGKRPLLMSVDNVGYPESRKKDGFASRLMIDDNNEITAVIRNPKGVEIVSRTAEIFPIVDDFIKAHPEFSYRGAKGMVGITGSWGVMGYDPKIASEAAIAKKIANRLKELGWDFVSHSYTHADGKYFSENSTLEGVKEDTELFKKWIVPIIGDSNVFIAPFGVTLKGELYQYMIDEGYTFYLTVDRRSQPKILGKSVLMPRINLDGFVMNRDKAYITEHFFDVDKVYDSRRPVFQ